MTFFNSYSFSIRLFFCLKNLAEVAFSENFYLLEELVKVVLILSRDVATLIDEWRIWCFE